MPEMPAAGYDPKLPESEAQAALQSAPFFDDISKLGLKNETNLFTSNKDDRSQAIFLLYYSRVK